MIEKIVSGGQTGVDRAALDTAIALNIPYGGWCPKGRIYELGIIPKKYEALTEVSGEFKNEKENYDARTIRNIADSDGTLILIPVEPLPDNVRDGTLLTIKEAEKRKPFLKINLSKPQIDNIEEIQNWVKKHNIAILNIAGPRESSYSGIYKISADFLKEMLISLNYTYKISSKL
jgi:hypothetical protein